MIAADFIRANLKLEPVPSLPHIRLYTAHPGSRLSCLVDDTKDDPPAPYWAYQWAGGLALAHHFASYPAIVSRKRLLDLGAGSGLVAIAAAQAGAVARATEIDPYGQIAIALNAAANALTIPLQEIDLSGAAPGDIDIIAAGDVFYNAEVATVMLAFLRRCKNAGIEVLIGDPDRRDLPRDQLDPIACYDVGDVGDARGTTDRKGTVYRLR